MVALFPDKFESILLPIFAIEHYGIEIIIQLAPLQISIAHEVKHCSCRGGEIFSRVSKIMYARIKLATILLPGVGTSA